MRQGGKKEWENRCALGEGSFDKIYGLFTFRIMWINNFSAQTRLANPMVIVRKKYHRFQPVHNLKQSNRDSIFTIFIIKCNERSRKKNFQTVTVIKSKSQEESAQRYCMKNATILLALMLAQTGKVCFYWLVQNLDWGIQSLEFTLSIDLTLNFHSFHFHRHFTKQIFQELSRTYKKKNGLIYYTVLIYLSTD